MRRIRNQGTEVGDQSSGVGSQESGVLRSSFRPGFIAVLASAALSFGVPAAWAQPKEQAIGSLAEIEKLLGGKSIKSLPGELSAALYKAEPTDLHKQILDTAAQYYVLRLTWPDHTGDPNKMDESMQEFKKRFIPEEGKAPKNLSPYFHQKLAENFRKVFARKFLDNRVSSINAAQMLLGLGRDRNRSISDLLTDLIKDRQQHEAIKHYAVKALADFFPLQEVSLDPTGDMLRVDILREYIERPQPAWPAWQLSKETDKDKALQENAAIFFLRREAIHTLARAELPAVRGVNQKGRGQVAVTLLRVLSKDARDGLRPPPPAVFDPVFGDLEMMGVAEKCQAAFGLCHFKKDPNYKFDVSVYAVGQCLSEFFDAYKKDRDNLIKGPGPVFDKDDERKMGRLHWKFMADRWKEALKNLIAGCDRNFDDRAKAQAIAMQKESAKVLDMILSGAIIPGADAKTDEKNFQRFVAEVDAFRNFLSDPTQKPFTKIMFKGNTSPEVNLGY